MSEEAGIKEFVDTHKLRDDISINPVDLDSAMLQHASLAVHYAQQAVYARRQYERYKSAFEILEARLDAEFRESLTTEVDPGDDSKKKPTVKKPTEAQIRAQIVQDKRWAGMNSRVIEAQTMMKLAEAASHAFDARRDMILEVARDRRKEREGELRVMSQNAAREAVTNILREKGVTGSY